ncbi:MAG: alpha/beta hydrolase [Nocardioidaceae bacterium]
MAMVDLCNYGQSSCGDRLTDDPAAQVKLVTDAARAEGSRRIALVGASMGGSLVLTVADATNPDAIVDLSGPAQFGSSDITADARHVSMPALFAFSDQDRADLTAVRHQLANMPTEQKLFLTYDSGHGYELLRSSGSGKFTSLATRVANWVKHPS